MRNEYTEKMGKHYFAEERRQKLIEYLNQHKRADVAELAFFFDIGEATIRRDLLYLESKALIQRTHGGAIQQSPSSLWMETPLEARQLQFLNEKTKIADFVQQLVCDGQIIMIDGGSTTLLVAQKLKSKNKLMLITNTSTIAEELVGINNNKVLLTGGELVHSTSAMIGPLAVTAISQFRADIAIIGVSGMILDDGLFSAIPQEAEIKQLMIRNAVCTIVVADSSKLETRALCRICSFSDIDKLVIDSGIAPETTEKIRNCGVEVIVV